MPTRLFTELSVSKLRHKASEADSQVTYYDAKQKGLILRLNQKGTKSWRVLYWHDGRTRSEALGHFRPGLPDHMSVKQARDAAANFRANKSAILSERTKQALANRDSFEVVAERYLKRFVDGKRRTAGQIRKMVEKLYPAWGQKSFESIKRSEVSKLLDDIEEKRGPRAADITLMILRRIMAKHAVAHDDYSSPICEGMNRIENPSHRARDRILNDDEIRALFKACNGLGVFGSFTKMLLLTAQRRRKVSTMKWEDIDDSGLWTIATEDREKGNAERLKLPKRALAILGDQKKLRLNDYVFPATRTPKGKTHLKHAGSLAIFGQGKVDLDKAMAAILPDIPQWQLHDLRRTARSLMSRAGVRPDIAERVLGHAIGGVQGVYDRHHYDRERAAALVSLSSLIGDILEPKRAGRVVAFRRRLAATSNSPAEGLRD
jgi:integrase